MVQLGLNPLPAPPPMEFSSASAWHRTALQGLTSRPDVMRGKVAPLHATHACVQFYRMFTSLTSQQQCM